METAAAATPATGREKGAGGGGGAELWNINGENWSPILEKEKLPVQNIPGNEWQNRII